MSLASLFSYQKVRRSTMRKQITGNEEIKLYSWMAQEGLKGNALVVYAIVYDAGEYSGGYRYLADFTGMEINSLIRLVGSMVKQGYLKKRWRRSIILRSLT